MGTAQTALARREPSAPSRMLVETGLIGPGMSVLDFGCGQGTDVDYYLGLGLDAYCYDPNWQPRKPTKRYDRVVMLYVLNVLDTPAKRRSALRQAMRFLKVRGYLIVVARSKPEVERSRTRAWTRDGDGYRTSTGSFQRGFHREELCAMIGAEGYTACPWNLGVSSAVACLGMKRAYCPDEE